MWVLGSEFWASKRAASALNCLAMSPTQALFLFMYMYEYMHVGVHECMCVYAYTHEWRPEEDVRCLPSLPTYPFEVGSLLEPECLHLVKLEASQPHNPVSVHVRAGFTGL